MSNQDIVLAASAITKSFQDGDLQTDVLKDISLTVNKGDRLAIVGSSGSGKSTLLHILGGLESPTSGEVTIKNQAIHSLSQRAAGQLRNQHLGFVYQFHHLLPEFTAMENVAMPLMIGGARPKQAAESALDMLALVGLDHRTHHKPAELSGGERQRAALARAMVTQPDCLLADEPTGNLDSNTADRIFDLLLDLNDKLGTALVIVTHDLQLAGRLDQQVTLVDGEIQSLA
jgi:lipoprotein-releasing system ATP-binding protein